MAANSIKLLTGNSHPQLAKLVADRLGIELAKTMSLNYSNQETSVTVGESVRDEDGKSLRPFSIFPPDPAQPDPPPRSIHSPIHRSRRHKRRAHGAPNHDQRLQDRLRAADHSRNPQLPLRATGQERQISSPHFSQADCEYAADRRLQSCYYDGFACESDTGIL
jgi:hypothetical protein